VLSRAWKRLAKTDPLFLDPDQRFGWEAIRALGEARRLMEHPILSLVEIVRDGARHGAWSSQEKPLMSFSRTENLGGGLE